MEKQEISLTQSQASMIAALLSSARRVFQSYGKNISAYECGRYADILRKKMNTDASQ